MSWETVTSYNPTELRSGSGGRTRRVWVPANDISAGGSRIRVTFKAGNGTLGIDGASIGQKGTDYSFAEAPTRITFDGGSDTTIVAAGQEKMSDEITFILNPDIDHFIHITQLGDYSYAWSSSLASTYVRNNYEVDDTLVITPTSEYSLYNYLYLVTKIEVSTGDAYSVITDVNSITVVN